ncbi:MAG: hypothetical protein HY815_33465 [Candidatus Riflebacteria bacterium]|nr:hypothetical protein [Candidatus Riflebacteria bacterium]
MRWRTDRRGPERCGPAGGVWADRQGPGRGATLVEVVVSLALAGVALGLALDATVGFFRIADRRMDRTRALVHGLHTIHQLCGDLDQSVVVNDTPQVSTLGTGLVLTVPSQGRPPSTTRSVHYHLRSDVGALDRSVGLSTYQKIGQGRLRRVRFHREPLASDPASGAVAVSCLVEPDVPAVSGGSGPVTSRPLVLWTARVVEPAVCGTAPRGWVEPR